MKRVLSVFLAIVMVLSTVAFAAPSAVVVYETADGNEVSDLYGAADLMGTAYKMQRGINLLTGTKEPLTGENYSTYVGIFNISYSGSETLDVDVNPDEAGDSVIKWTIPAGVGGNYSNISVSFGNTLSNYIDHPYMYVSYDVMKSVPDTEGYNTVNSCWIMGTNASASNVVRNHGSNVTPTSGWYNYSELLNLNWCNQDSSVATESTDHNKLLVFHAFVSKENTVPVYYYFDNMIVAPAYKVTYYNAAGTEIVKEEYIAADEDGNLLTSFMPAGFVAGRGTYGGWSETIGGTPVTEAYTLDSSLNSDFVFYATVEQDAFDGATLTADTKLNKIGATATVTANLVGDPDVDADYVTWTSSNTSAITVSKNKDGKTALLTAVGEGTSTITYTYQYNTDGSTASVTGEFEVAVGAKTDFSGLNTDTYEYVTVNVTNTGSANSVTISYTTDEGSDTKTVTVPAGVSGYDVYADMTNEENWSGTLSSLSVTAGTGVTVNNTKVWAALATELALKFNTVSEYIGYADYTLNVEALVDCDLEGVYDKTYTWTTDVTNDCATVTEQADGSINVVSNANADGFVTLTATSNENSSVSITKKILVKTTDEVLEKAIAYTWDFEDTTGWGFSGHHNTSSFSDGVMTVVKNATGSSTYVQATSGTDGYTLATITSGSASEGGKNTTDFVLSEYPYLCIVAKTENPGTFALRAYVTTDTLGDHAATRCVDISAAVTGEYQTFVFDTTKIGEEDPTGNYGGIMFCNNTVSIIDSSTISDNVASSPLTYSTYKPLMVEEMYFANYDPTVEEEQLVGLDLTADKTTLTGEGTITLTSGVYSNVEITNKNVVYSIDNDIVTVFDNGDGTATVTPISNGTVTITSTSVLDSSATDTITLTISGVQTKIVAYDLSMISLGNSYLCHGYAEWFDKDLYNGWINADDEIRGMAASEPDLDYYGRIQYYINENLNCSLKAHRVANSTVEKAWMSGLANSSNISNLDGFDYAAAKTAILDSLTEQLAYIKSEQTNIITIQLAENAKFDSAHTEVAEFFYDTVFAAIDEVRPEESVVVVITTFGSGTASNAEILKAAEYGYYVANCTDMTDSKWKAYDQYPNFSNPNTTSDFRSHPGDLGMDEIGKRVFAQLETAIPATIPAEYIYVPDSIAIEGANAITEDEGTITLSIAAEPSENSTTSVNWSVDNENVATIDEDGVLTAKNNGTVVVTAVCAYDSTVTATLEVTVSGQVPAYTLTYAGGTVDTVTNLPDADAYAKGEYTLSTSAPERNGYKFKGWSLSVGGEVVTTVTMDSDKTVYATWEFATAWEFDTEGDLEGISLGGFHPYCRYEEVPGMVVATVTYYDGSPVTVYDTTLLVPSDDYNEFAVRLQATETTADDTLNLTLTNDAGTKYEYSLPMTTAAMTEYVFDISDVEGTITGFLLEPSFVELTLYVDYIRFQKGAEKVEVTEDTTVDSLTFDGDKKLDAGDYTYTVTGAVEVPEDTTLYLEAGTYVFSGNLTGNVVASPNANVIVKGANRPSGYVEIDIGAATGTRYAEVDGVQLEIKENADNLYGVIAAKNLLVQIVDTGAASLASDTTEEYTTEETITRYFHVNVTDEAYTELPMGNYMSNVEGQELRSPDEDTNSLPGLRFRAGVDVAKKNDTSSYKITEYGYIIGLEETLVANDEELNFNASAYVSGKAYVKGSYDKVFDQSSDSYHIFTGVLYGAPKDQYAKNLVAKTYTKVTVGEDNYVIYGEPMVANFFDIAKALKAEGNLSEEAQAIVDDIINEATGPDIGFDWGDL